CQVPTTKVIEFAASVPAMSNRTQPMLARVTLTFRMLATSMSKATRVTAPSRKTAYAYGLELVLRFAVAVGTPVAGNWAPGVVKPGSCRWRVAEVSGIR